MLTPEQINAIRQQAGAEPVAATSRQTSGSLVDDLGLKAPEGAPIINDQLGIGKTIKAATDFASGAVRGAVDTINRKGQENLTDMKTQFEKTKKAPTLLGKTKEAARGALRFGGNVIETAFELPIAAVTEGVSDIKPVQQFAQKEGVSKGLDKTNEALATALGPALQKFEEIKQKNPELVHDLEDAVNILVTAAGATPVQRAASEAISTTKKGVQAVADTVNPLLKELDLGLSQASSKALSVLSGRTAARTKEELKAVAGAIAQGKKTDVPAAIRALSDIDTTGVKTYKDLVTALDDKVTALAGELDTTLTTKTDKFKLSDWAQETKVGEKTVKYNFVEDSLKQLQELYTKIKDPVALEKSKQLTARAKKEGLTVKEVNDLARQYGNEFSQKAFSKTGEPLTSTNAQGVENTRSGIKDTARTKFGDEAYAAGDKALTDTIKTRDLVKKTEEAVTKLSQKVEKRTKLQSLGRGIAIAFDTVTGGTVSSFLQKMIVPRSNGLKVMNALDLEAALSKNLKKLQDLAAKADSMTDEALGKELEAIFPAAEAAPKINMKSGAIKNPFASKPAPKIPSDDLATMSDFTDYHAGSYRPTPDEAHRLELDATRLWEQYFPDKPLPKTRSGIANEFGRQLEERNFTRSGQPRDEKGRYDTNA